jgi:hypothetical protein
MADDAPVDLEALVPLLNDYLNAAGWPEARRVLERHPQLLTDVLDEPLMAAVANLRTQGNVDAVERIEWRAWLLARSREVGVDLAYAEFVERLARYPVPEAARPRFEAADDRLEVFERTGDLGGRSTLPSRHMSSSYGTRRPWG